MLDVGDLHLALQNLSGGLPVVANKAFRVNELRLTLQHIVGRRLVRVAAVHFDKQTAYGMHHARGWCPQI